MQEAAAEAPEPGFREWLGLEPIEIGERHATGRIAITKEKINGRGVAHGGVVAAILDSIMGLAISGPFEARRRWTVTLELKINYMARLPMGTATASARIVTLNETTGVVEGEIRREDGELVACAQGTWMVKQPRELELIRQRAAAAQAGDVGRVSAGVV